MKKKAFSPTGFPIEGTNDHILGTALADIYKDDDGGIVTNFWGETRVCWDSQETIEENGEITYVDSQGDVWRESQLVWRAI